MGDDSPPRRAVAAAHAAWPPDWVPGPEFEAYAEERAGAGELRDEAAAALYLACACVRGVAAAVQAFEAAYLSDVRRACARAGLVSDQVTEVTQALREQLLVGRNGGPPTLGEYKGRGDLRAWLRVTATRAAIRAKKRDGRAAGADLEPLEARAAGDDPELAYMKALYRKAFRAAFQAATESLEPEERKLLHDHTVLGRSIDELGSERGVHRATAARWVQAAREKLFAATRKEFARNIRVSPRELASVFRLVESRLDVTMKRLLAC